MRATDARFLDSDQWILGLQVQKRSLKYEQKI